MKPQYRKKKYAYRGHDPKDFYYEHVQCHYHRRVRTFPELRDNYGARTDLRGLPKSCHPRACRSLSELDAWNDFNRSRSSGKSWKDFTRYRKQWMVCNDPEPVVDPPRWNMGAWLAWGSL